MNMNLYTHEFQWLWILNLMNFNDFEKNIWAVWLWIRREVDLFIKLIKPVWIWNLYIFGVYEQWVGKAYLAQFYLSPLSLFSVLGNEIGFLLFCTLKQKTKINIVRKFSRALFSFSSRAFHYLTGTYFIFSRTEKISREQTLGTW